MSTKAIRKDGKWITVNTKTGEEVKPGQGLLGQYLRNIKDWADDFGNNLVYSDEVDEKGRPLTVKQVEMGVRNVDDRELPYKGRKQGLKNVYPERYSKTPANEKPTPVETPAPVAAPTPVPVVTEEKPVDGLSDFTKSLWQEGDVNYRWGPGFRENPLTAGSMKGDHAFINPRQKAIMAREEMLDRSREKKAWREQVGDIKTSFQNGNIDWNDNNKIGFDENDLVALIDLPNSKFIDTSKIKPVM